MSPKFSEMAHVWVRIPEQKELLGGVVLEFREKEGRWIYKVQHVDMAEDSPTFDNWYPEDWLDTGV